MKTKTTIAAIAIAATLAWQAGAQIYDTNGAVVQTLAGSGFSDYVDGVGQLTMFNGPRAIVSDSSGNLFVSDYFNYRIRKITPSGDVSTFVGGGSSSPPNYGTNISLGATLSMTIDHSNTLYLIDLTGTSMLRVGVGGYASRILLNGLAAGEMRRGLCVDSVNNIYISDSGNKIYRYRTNGVLEVFAGSGNSGSVDGNGIFTSFNNPRALAADSADNIYVWDSGNTLIRRINPNRDVVTIAGKKTYSADSDGVGMNASFYLVSAMCADEFGNVFLACYSSTGGESIRKMSATTNVTTIAGSFSQGGYTNGAGAAARFYGAGEEGICISQGTIFLADFGNQRIRQISFNPTTQPVLPANLQLSLSPSLRITGTVGRTYRVESSPDITNWTTRTTLLLTQSPYLWIDQSPVSGNKFYRALLLP